MSQNGIRHIFTAPYHPASNGQAERTVQTFKNALKRIEQNGESVETRVSRFVFTYRITPQTTTGVSPSELLFNRRLRSALDFIKPDLSKRVKGKQLNAETHSNRSKPLRQFRLNESVMMRNYGQGPKWISGHILKQLGPVTYELAAGDRVVQRHVDQMLRAGENLVDAEETRVEKPTEIRPVEITPEPPIQQIQPESPVIQTEAETENMSETEVSSPPLSSTITPTVESSIGFRRSSRNHQTPKHFADFEMNYLAHV